MLLQSGFVGPYTLHWFLRFLSWEKFYKADKIFLLIQTEKTGVLISPVTLPLPRVNCQSGLQYPIRFIIKYYCLARAADPPVTGSDLTALYDSPFRVSRCILLHLQSVRTIILRRIGLCTLLTNSDKHLFLVQRGNTLFHLVFL